MATEVEEMVAAVTMATEVEEMVAAVTMAMEVEEMVAAVTMATEVEEMVAAVTMVTAAAVMINRPQVAKPYLHVVPVFEILFYTFTLQNFSNVKSFLLFGSQFFQVVFPIVSNLLTHVCVPEALYCANRSGSSMPWSLMSSS